MLTAVIILNWNGYDMLTACMQSLRRAEGDFFVVVADNNSTDGSQEKFLEWTDCNGIGCRRVDEGCEDGVKCVSRDVLLYCMKENYGFAKGNNKAVSLAMQSSPERILLLNNDTEVEPDFLLKLEAFRSAHPEYKVLTPLIHFFYDKTKIWNAGGELKFGFRKYFYANKTRADVKETVFKPITFVTGCALYLPTSLLYDGGKVLTERFFFGEEDFDFSLRMKKQGVKMACVMDSVIYHKVGSSIKKELLPGKMYIHYLNRFIDVRLHYGKLFSEVWMAVYKPYIRRTLKKQGCPEWMRGKFVKHLYSAARTKDSVTAEDFRTALAGGWSGVAGRKPRLFMLSDSSSDHTKRWVSSIAVRGVEICLFSFNNKDTDFYGKIDNVSCFSMDIFSRFKDQRRNGAFEKLRYLKTFSMVKQCIKEFDPDILHAHYATSYALLGILAGFRPLVVSMWGSDIYRFPHVSPIHKMLLKYNLSKADKLLSTSNCMAREASKYTSNKMTVTPFGIDEERFKPIEKGACDTFVVGTVKTLDFNCGIDTLIDAFSIVRKENPDKKMRLLIAGDGPDREIFKRQAKASELADEVEFLGKIPNSEVPALLSRMDIYVALSRKESFGVAALEAMACEVPVVVSSADGFVEVVPDGKAGYLVPADNAQAAAEKISYLLNNPDIVREMGKVGRIHVLENYRWKISVDIMMDVYKSLL